MVLRPDSRELVRRIRNAKNTLRLSQSEMAAELRIRSEWLSKIMNGHQPPSYNIGLRFEDFLRRHRLAVDASGVTEMLPTFPDRPNHRVSSAKLRAEVFLRFSRLIAAAQNKPQRLAWIAEQLRTTVAIPAAWKKKRQPTNG